MNKTILLSIALCLNLPSANFAEKYQLSETDLKPKIESLKKEINHINVLRAEFIPVSHELYNYFDESILIIERSMGFIQKDIQNQDWINAEIGLKEADFLSSFLNEEIKINMERDTAKYRIIDVTTFGLIGDGKFDNSYQIENLLSKIKSYNQHVKLLFPEGEYFIKIRNKGNGISVLGQKDITFEGVGKVKFIFDNSNVGGDNLLISNSKNIEFRNISIDMNPLPFTMGTIVSIESGNEIIVRINEGYPKPDKSYSTAKFFRGLVRNPQTGKIEMSCGDPRITGIESLGDDKYLLTIDDNSLSGNQDMTTHFKTNYYFTIHPRQRPGAGSGVKIVDSKHLLFSRFNINAADGHVYTILRSAGIKFLECIVEPGEGRLVLNNADGFHCGSNLKGIFLDRCKVVNTNDDCLAFFTRLHSVGKVEADNKFIILSGVGQPSITQNYKVGDAIAFVNANSGKYDGVTSIKSVKELTNWEGQRYALLIQTVDPVKNLISRDSVGRDFEIKEREYVPSGGDNYRKAMAIKAPFEHQIVNLSTKNDGWIILNSEFGFNRANGFRIKAPNGVIRNSKFHEQVIVFISEFNWWGGIYPEKIEMTDVIIDKGIRLSGMLPGQKKIDNNQLSMFMRYIHFKNVNNASGKAIKLPWEINNALNTRAE